jgi:hypothetical protein
VFAIRSDRTYLIDNISSRYEQRFEKGIQRRGEIIYIDGELQWRFENPKSIGNKTLISIEANPLNLVCREVELFLNKIFKTV